jgi:hypothetical protein
MIRKESSEKEDRSMNKLIIAIGLILSCFQAYGATNLDGRTYCRIVHSESDFGQPIGDRKVCISFNEGLATNTESTFFGNAPLHEEYRVYGNKLVFGSSTYEISADGTTLTTVSGSTTRGTIFKLLE